MIQCDKEAKNAIKNCQDQETTLNIKYYGYYAITHNDTLRDRSINKIIRIHDAIEMEKLYCKRKIKEQVELVDSKARNYFQIG